MTVPGRAEWIRELAESGVRCTGGKRIRFRKLEPLADGKMPLIHATGVADAPAGHRVALTFGPRDLNAPMGADRIMAAARDVPLLSPPHTLAVFAAFHFDPAALAPMGPRAVPVLMDHDLLTAGLKRTAYRGGSDSFWAVGLPEVWMELLGPRPGGDRDRYRIDVRGMLQFDPDENRYLRHGAGQIAQWMLDPDWGGLEIVPEQMFFPADPGRKQWRRMSKKLKKHVDPSLAAAYEGFRSLPFFAGPFRRAAVKVTDLRGVETLVSLDLAASSSSSSRTCARGENCG